MMENSADAESLPPVIAGPPSIDMRAWMKRIIARNPFYLISAGLLLYGINQLTTDPKLVGAEFSMLRFNFCALIIYEVMLVVTAISLARRGVWYDALLLVGLSNLFIIVPFSLISRAVLLDSKLALAMSVIGVLLATGKFLAFKRYIPSLNFPARLLVFGAALLLANADAPSMFNAIANKPEIISQRLNLFWLVVLPMFAGLANFLPKSGAAVDSPGKRRWLPMMLYFGWIVVTACHFGGLGFSLGFDWRPSLLSPVAWVTAWTLYLRRKDFMRNPGATAEQLFLSVPLLLPLLALGGRPALLVFAVMNCLFYIVPLILNNRNRFALIRFAGAMAILLGSLPAPWFNHAIPEVSQARWLVACIAICFFWMIFLSRDPRIALGAVLALLAICIFIVQEFAQLAFQIGHFCFHPDAQPIRWEDCLHKGATVFRILTGMLWVLLASSWVRESAYVVCLPPYIPVHPLLFRPAGPPTCGHLSPLETLDARAFLPDRTNVETGIEGGFKTSVMYLTGFPGHWRKFPVVSALGSLVAFSKPERHKVYPARGPGRYYEDKGQAKRNRVGYRFASLFKPFRARPALLCCRAVQSNAAIFPATTRPRPSGT